MAAKKFLSQNFKFITESDARRGWKLVHEHFVGKKFVSEQN